jgi:hypothetical protein
MSTLIAVVILIVIGCFGALVWPTILNLAAVPGTIIESLFFVGMLVATALQSYIYLAFVALVVSGTKYYIHQGALSPIFVWPACFVACFLPMYVAGPASMRMGNPLVMMATFNTVILTVVGFFVFAFFPNVIALGWPWTPWLS